MAELNRTPTPTPTRTAKPCELRSVVAERARGIGAGSIVHLGQVLREHVHDPDESGAQTSLPTILLQCFDATKLLTSEPRRSTGKGKPQPRGPVNMPLARIASPQQMPAVHSLTLMLEY